MSFYVAGSMFAAGTYSAVNKRKGAMANANERRRAARESLITAGFNIRERTIEGQRTQFGVLEQGGAVSQKIAIAGKQAEGSAKASMGGGGALVETGSNRATLTSIAQTAVAEQTNVIIQTKNQIKAIARDTTNANKSEWRNAKLNQEQQNRIASREKGAANKQFTSDMAETTLSAYMGGSSMAGTGNVAKWGKTASTAKKSMTAAQLAGSAVGPAGRYQKKGVGPAGRYSSSINKTPKKGRLKKITSIPSMSDKQRRGPSTMDKMIYQAKTRSFKPFSKSAWGQTMDFSKGRVGKGDYFGQLINFLKGTGWKGRAKRGRMRGASK